MSAEEPKISKETFQCGHCANRTLMRLVADASYTHTYDDPDSDYVSRTRNHIKILVCPHCHGCNIYRYSLTSGRGYGEDPEEEEHHLYPISKTFADSSKQAINIQEAYEDAVRCFKLGLFTPCVVMCRKTLEMLCNYFTTSNSSQLYGMLEEMRRKGIIDNKLYEWANTLRNFGNEAAHTITRFSEEDAQDILNFTYALVEYCIDFEYKFEKLLERRGKRTPKNTNDELISDEQAEILVEALDDSEPSIKYYAAITLARNGRELSKAISVLLAFVEKKTKNYSDAAKKGLKSIGAPAVDEITSILRNSQNPNVKETAAIALSEIDLSEIGERASEVLDTLVNALKDSDENVRFRAALAIEKIGLNGIDVFTKAYSSKVNQP